MLHYWHNKGLIVLLIFSSPDNWFSRCPRQSEGGFFRESNFAPVFCCPILVLAAEFQSVPHVFLEISGFFGSLPDSRLLSKSLWLTEHTDVLALKGEGPGACWTLWDVLKPSSLQWSLSRWSSWWSRKWLFQVWYSLQQFSCMYSHFDAKWWCLHIASTQTQ